ncbi:4Fe-4S ferredoxin [Spirulina subsalsa FACHB-351]|uniref:4Fe-4S ferredoxin n=1 Tax=Spirulina subsalsa FACHB-351 TaxID=234711 RepID=A0ABT3L2Z3_9CYAN|nr:4Fe-4S ferredoxin [Spirulina subsalsa FACHB-351]
MIEIDSPLNSLQSGCWFKLICGASFQHLPAIRNLTLAYALGGADCIDVAADPAVIAATQEAIGVACALQQEAQARGFLWKTKPWLMVSLNDGEDPHFRKAVFDPQSCPPHCPRPCEGICPAEAIAFGENPGVIEALCYGCGRCLPVCPSQLITAQSYVSTPEIVVPLLFDQGIDALEIHTQTGHFEGFQRLWQAIAPYQDQLKILAISCPDHQDLIPYLKTLYHWVSPLPCPLIWQTDGRPMSGDIGKGTTRAAVKLAAKVLAAHLPGYVQLAGGTNQQTVEKLRQAKLLNFNPSLISSEQTIAGVAYGSYARTQLTSLLHQLEERSQSPCGKPQLEHHPDLLWQAVALAHQLVAPLKGSPPVSRQEGENPGVVLS